MDFESTREILEGKFETAREGLEAESAVYDISGAVVDNQDLIYETNQTAADAYTSVESPGFGAIMAGVALVSASLLALRRDNDDSFEDKDEYDEDKLY